VDDRAQLLEDGTGEVGGFRDVGVDARVSPDSFVHHGAHYHLPMSKARTRIAALFCIAGGLWLAAGSAASAATNKPALHGKHWVAITGKPLAATAGA
jgi:hypothetical protein